MILSTWCDVSDPAPDISPTYSGLYLYIVRFMQQQHYQLTVRDTSTYVQAIVNYHFYMYPIVLYHWRKGGGSVACMCIFDDLHTSIANVKYSYSLIPHIFTFVKAVNELSISEQIPASRHWVLNRWLIMQIVYNNIFYYIYLVTKYRN